MCVTSYGTEILQSQLNRSEKRRRCTHRNESPCLLRVVGEGRGSFPVVLCCLRPASVFCSLCAWLHLQRGGAQPMRRSLFVYILPPPRKGNKRSRGSHFMEMCFFSPSPPTAFHTRYTRWLKFRGRKRTHACVVALILSKKINP